MSQVMSDVTSTWPNSDSVELRRSTKALKRYQIQNESIYMYPPSPHSPTLSIQANKLGSLSLLPTTMASSCRPVQEALVGSDLKSHSSASELSELERSPKISSSRRESRTSNGNCFRREGYTPGPSKSCSMPYVDLTLWLPQSL